MSEEKLELVNANKRAEEVILRSLDLLAARGDIDQSWLALGRTYLELGFMSINRAVFQPECVKLPGDPE